MLTSSPLPSVSSDLPIELILLSVAFSDGVFSTCAFCGGASGAVEFLRPVEGFAPCFLCSRISNSSPTKNKISSSLRSFFFFAAKVADFYKGKFDMQPGIFAGPI